MNAKTLKLVALLAVGGLVAYFLWQRKKAAAVAAIKPKLPVPLPVSATPKASPPPKKKGAFDSLLGTVAEFGDDVFKFGKAQGAQALNNYVQARSASGY